MRTRGGRKGARFVAFALIGVLGGCAGGLENGPGAKKDPNVGPLGQPTTETSALRVRETRQSGPGLINRNGTMATHAERRRSKLQIASADTSNAGGKSNRWEVSQTKRQSEAERSRITRMQIAQDTAKQSGQSGATDLSAANKEFNNPLTAATLFIVENDTLFLDGDLSNETKVANVTVIEPIIPVPLGNTGWALVNRPILPIAINAPIPVAGSGGGAAEGGTFSFDSHDGLGDLTFFSLLAPPVKGNFKYGFGPSFQFPTATRDELGSEKYSVGPAAVALYGTAKFTVGMLTQSWFSFAGNDNRNDVKKSTFQYFAFYNFTPQWGIGMAPIISVNWDAKDNGDKLALPIGLGVTHTFKVGKFPARMLLEGQYYAVQRDSFGPESNIRLAFGLFLPKLFGN